jgi:UDP-2-acetamido-3-amino-2,3-dideoxy-glucuronate N-acetyltransferase
MNGLVKAPDADEVNASAIHFFHGQISTMDFETFGHEGQLIKLGKSFNGTDMKLMGKFYRIEDCKIGEGTVVWDFVNLFGCTIGNGCRIGSYTEIGTGVIIGDRCKVEPYAFIPPGVIIEDEVFIGPHVCFTNDYYPRAVGDWEIVPTTVEKRASIGANSTILCGITIGEGAMVAAGSVVTKNVPPRTLVAGNPAVEKGMVRK